AGADLVAVYLFGQRAEVIAGKQRRAALTDLLRHARIEASPISRTLEMTEVAVTHIRPPGCASAMIEDDSTPPLPSRSRPDAPVRTTKRTACPVFRASASCAVRTSSALT